MESLLRELYQIFEAELGRSDDPESAIEEIALKRRIERALFTGN